MQNKEIGSQSQGEYRILLSEALPELFEFYHLGQVRRVEATLPASEPALLLGYAFQGDVRGAIVVLVDEITDALDESAAEELGNVISGRWISRQPSSIDLMLSAPTRVSRASLERMVANAALAARAGYELRATDGKVMAKLTALVLAEALVAEEPARNA